MHVVLCCGEAVGTRHANNFFRGILKEDVFIRSSKGRELAEHLLKFVKVYAWQAAVACSWNQTHFPMMPKLHMLHEVSIEMLRQCEAAEYCMNPAVETCQMDEDFVGRTAVITRSVSPRLQAQRTLQRYLCQINLAWGQAV